MFERFLQALTIIKQGSIPFFLWTLREWLVKKILLLQAKHPQVAYRLWQKLRVIPGPDPAQVTLQLASFIRAGQPLVSFIVYLDQEDTIFDLKRTLAALQNQQVKSWEAWVYADASREKEIQTVFELLGGNPRCYFGCGTQESGKFIYERSIEHARGEFVAWVQAGGAFVPQAVAEMARHFLETPDADLLYFDEDVFLEDTTAAQAPFFKPGWSPELLLSINYVRGAFFRKNLLAQALLVDTEHPISSEWDLTLRCSPHFRHPERIARVLFHRPNQAGRVRKDKDQDEQALITHLERSGLVQPQILNGADGFPRLSWQQQNHKISVIIPTKDHLNVLKKCLDSVLSVTENIKLEIIIIDTGSQDPAVKEYYQSLHTRPEITFIFDPAPFNYSRVNNIGAARATGDLFLFLNNDVEALEPGWLEELSRWMEVPGIGVVGPKLLFPDGTIQHAGIVIGMEGHCSHVFGFMPGDHPNPYGSLNWYRNYLAVTGACLMTSRVVFEQMGGFNEDYLLVFSDIEFCLRVFNQGFRILYTPFCKLIHHEGKSRAGYIPPQDIQLGYKHFIDQVRKGDPYYHPNLSYSVRQPVFAWGFEETPEKRLEMINRHAQRKLSDKQIGAPNQKVNS